MPSLEHVRLLEAALEVSSPGSERESRKAGIPFGGLADL